MKPLPSTFRRDGFNFNTVQRAGNVVLLSKRHDDCTRDTFEVCVLHQRKAGVVFGNQVEDRESMPSNEDWGTRGWSYSDLPTAQKRFDEQIAKHARIAKT